MAKQKSTAKESDPGLFPGLVVASLVLAVWGAAEFKFSAPPSPQASTNKDSSFTKTQDAIPPKTRTLDDLVPSKPVADSSFRDDARWKEAGDVSDKALAQYQADLEESEKEGGINLLASRADLKKSLEEAVTLLNQMETDYQNDAVALEQIDRRRKRLQKNLGFTVGK